MITKWTIENFKSFQKRTDIELAPVTIFAGANSSGKSTIIQSILVLKQTVQYAPPTRAMALNGPMLKLGTFNDVKNATSALDFIGLGWEMQLEGSGDLSNRVNYGSSFASARYWGRNSIKSVTGDFTWEVPQSDEIGPGGTGISDALRQLQPKLKTSRIRTTTVDENSPDRFVTISRQSDYIAPSGDSDFGYSVPFVDEASSQEMLLAKPDGKIIGAAPRHFFPGQVAIQYDGAREKAFRVASALCTDEPYRYRTPALNSIKIPLSVVRLFQDRLQQADEEHRNQYPLLAISDEVTFEMLADSILQTTHRLDAVLRSRATKKRFNFLDLRPQVDLLMFEYFVKQVDVQREAVELTFPRYIFEASDLASAYFISAVRYLGPLRDEPKPIYPLEALANPTEVGYKGEHTAAVLDLHRDKRIRYLPSDFISSGLRGKPRYATLHDAVVDWLNYVGVASEVRTSDSGKFGHQIQVQTPGVAQYHDLTNVGVGVSQVLPIIVMALLAEPPSLLIFEQPELHLHPKVQARLADFFLSVALSGKQCLLETHSEYMVERFRLRIAEAEGESLTKTVKLYFTERNEGDTSCRQVPVSRYGAISDWPKDFFDQAQIETERILQAARQKRKLEKRESGNSE